MIFHWLFCIKYQLFLSTCGACLEVVFESERISTYFGSLRAKLILAPLVNIIRFSPLDVDS